jgi:hypothetical protein
MPSLAFTPTIHNLAKIASIDDAGYVVDGVIRKRSWASRVFAACLDLKSWRYGGGSVAG